MEKTISLAIVDDHTLFRKGISELFSKHEDFNVMFEASNGLELFEKIKEQDHFPDVILLDLKMPEMNGLECLKQLNNDYPNHKTLVLSMYDDSPFVMKSLKSGAKGFVLKDAETKDLFQAVKSVHTHGLYVNQSLAETLIHNIKKVDEQSIFSSYDPLAMSNQDLEMLTLVCQGLTNLEISKIIHRSSRTVEGYRQKLLDKTNTKNTAALVAWAFRKGLVE